MKKHITLIGNGFASLFFIQYFLALPFFPFLKRRNIRFVDGIVTDIQDGGRTVIASGEVYKNDALFIGIGPAFLDDDIPGTKEHTLSPCNGPDEMEKFMSSLDSMNKGTIYLGFKINRQGRRRVGTR